MDKTVVLFIITLAFILQFVSTAEKKSSRRGCIFQFSDDHLLIYKNQQRLLTEAVTLQYNETVTFRCSDISTHSFVGQNYLTCSENSWDEKFPECKVLTPGNPHQAPVIEYAVENGEYVVAYNGSLMVSEHSNLVLGCWWFRKQYGENFWKWKGHKSLPPSVKKQLILNAYYELRVDGITKRHEGVYSCVNPNGQAHGIDVRVMTNSTVELTTISPGKGIVLTGIPSENNHCNCDCDVGNGGKYTTVNGEEYDNNDDDSYLNVTEIPKNTTCKYELGDTNLLAYRNEHILSQDTILYPEEILVFRCRDISLQLLVGTNNLVCGENGWLGKIPRCELLSHRNSDKAPVVSYKVSNGEHEIAPNGSLFITEDASLLLNCWWFRNRYGLARWSWNKKFITQVAHITTYWQGNGNLILRVDELKKNHEGVYSCSNPKAQEHGIDIKIIRKTEQTTVSTITTSAEPSEQPTTPTSGIESEVGECVAMSFENLNIYENGIELTHEKMIFPSSTSLVFRCQNGLTHRLEGVTRVQCVNTSWSHPWPNCQNINANNWQSPPPVSVSSNIEPIRLDNGDYLLPIGTNVYFQCYFGHVQPIMYINNVLVKKNIYRSEGDTPEHVYWYVSMGTTLTARSFIFTCYIPRGIKEEKLSNSITIRIGAYCSLSDDEKVLITQRFPNAVILPSSLRALYVEGDVLNFGCRKHIDRSSYIPEGIRCNKDGVWDLQQRVQTKCTSS